DLFLRQYKYLELLENPLESLLGGNRSVRALVDNEYLPHSELAERVTPTKEELQNAQRTLDRRLKKAANAIFEQFSQPYFDGDKILNDLDKALRAGVHPDVKVADEGMTFLHFASAHGLGKVVDRLIE